MPETICWTDRTPGPRLAAELADVDPAELADDELIDVMTAWRRQASWAQAGELAAVAELARRRAAGSSRNAEFTSAEVGLALAISPRSADAHVDFARALAERLPLTRQAFGDGRIDFLKARVIAQGTAAVDGTVAAAVERRVLPGASEQTPGRLRARVERAVIALDPFGTERRRKAAEADRRVECHDTGSGTAVLAGVHLPAAPAIAADDRLHAIARAIKADGDPRTLDQVSADVFLSLLLGTHPGSGLPVADLVRPAEGDGVRMPAADPGAAGRERRGASAGARPGFSPADRPGSRAEDRSGFVAGGRSGFRAEDRPGFVAGDRPGFRAGDRRGSRAGDRPGSRAEGRSGSGEHRPHDDADVAPVADRHPSDVAARLAMAESAMTARAVGGRIGTVHLTVPLLTLIGLSDEPGEVAGYGPLTAEVARQMAAAAADPKTRWCVTVYGSGGEPLHHGHPTYRPPPRMAHLVEVFQPTCAFPGCQRPARSCDLDHRVAYGEGGPTCPCNLNPLCRRHHRVKQADGWSLDEHDGRLTWTTPAGKTYAENPAVAEENDQFTGHAWSRSRRRTSRGGLPGRSAVEERWRRSAPVARCLGTTVSTQD